MAYHHDQEKCWLSEKPQVYKQLCAIADGPGSMCTIEQADKELEKKCKLHQEGSKLAGDFGMWSSTVVGFTPAGRGEGDEDTKLACMGELQFVDCLRERQLGN